MTDRLQPVTADTTFPVTLSEVKDHLGITLTDDDKRLEGYIDAASTWAERSVRGGIATRTQTWDLIRPDFPGGQNSRGRIEFPKPPLQSVTTVKYLDNDSVLTTLVEDTDYRVALDFRGPGWIVPMPDTFWPTVRDQRDDGVQIRFVAGHATNALVPSNIKHAMLMLIAHWNENREAVITGTTASVIPFGIQNLIDQSEVGRSV